MHAFHIRSCHSDDLPVLKEIMVQAFDGVSIDQAIENHFGTIQGHNWEWRKARHLDDDSRRDPAGILVAVAESTIAGFVSTWMDREGGIGHIPNISIRPEFRGQGLGRRLLHAAMDRFRQHGLHYAKIETLAHNEIGNHLYRSVGFQEVARQVHFVADLNSPESNSPIS